MTAPRMIVFRCPVLEAQDHQLGVASLASWEGISQIDEVKVELWQHAEQPLDDLTLRALPGSPGAVAWTVGDGEVEDAWLGVVRDVEILTPVSPGYFAYRLTLVSPLHLLTLDRLSRVFQAKTVPDIVRQILTKDYSRKEGTHFEMRLEGSYPTREYTVQYQESSFVFINRLLEDEGIFYFTIATPTGPRLVFADSNASFEALPNRDTVAYSVAEELHTIGTLSRTYRLGPRHVVLRDYNWRTPTLALQVSAPVDDEDGHGVGVRVYYGDHFKDEAEGKRLAAIRAEELACGKHELRGTGRCSFLRPGHTFTLEKHPLFDLDREEYVVTSVWHRASQHGVALGADAGEQEGHRCEFSLIPKSLPFRPQRRAPRPMIVGIMHGRIDGGSSSTATPLDADGRYKVTLPFDAVGKPGGSSSRWVRRAQPYSGYDYGMHFPLHIGTEVAIGHVGGDPDRPVILGAVPNTDTVSPVSEGNATQSAIKTHGGIVFQLEDDA